MRCCIRWYAHFKAADAGDSSTGFLGSSDARGVSIELLISIAKRTASLTDLKLCSGQVSRRPLYLQLWHSPSHRALHPQDCPPHACSSHSPCLKMKQWESEKLSISSSMPLETRSMATRGHVT